MCLLELEKLKLHAESVGDLKEFADCCNSLGALYAENGEYEEALDEHRAELTAAEACGNQVAVALAHRRIGECLMNMGEFENAELNVSDYLALSQSLDDEYNTQLAYHVLGLVHLKWAELIGDGEPFDSNRTSHLMQSHEFFRKSYVMCKAAKDQRGIKDRTSAVLLNLGMVKSLLKNYGDSFDALKEAMKLAVESSNSDLLQRCYYELSVVCYQRHDLAAAEAYCRELLTIAVKRHSKEEQVDAYLNLFHVYIEQENIKKALDIIQRAKRLKCTSHVEWSQVISYKKSAKKMQQSIEQLKEIAAANEPVNRMKLFEKIADLLAESLSTNCMKHLELALKYYEKMVIHQFVIHSFTLSLIAS
ncbi:unnamed protein product [Soboliphyme baturini]|uniref:TPR_REGION domain-containing protein n=1 Tax=Soboliphyme baturini TaxID=241478 RepID=A0A183IT87_9BILA|nr:unnamed protein product [Soboliphyme baturini]